MNFGKRENLSLSHDHNVSVDHRRNGRQRVVKSIDRTGAKTESAFSPARARSRSLIKSALDSTSRLPQQTLGSVKFVAYFYFLVSIVFVYWKFGLGNCRPCPIYIHTRCACPFFHSIRAHWPPPTELSSISCHVPSHSLRLLTT